MVYWVHCVCVSKKSHEKLKHFFEIMISLYTYKTQNKPSYHRYPSVCRYRNLQNSLQHNWDTVTCRMCFSCCVCVVLQCALYGGWYVQVMPGCCVCVWSCCSMCGPAVCTVWWVVCPGDALLLCVCVWSCCVHCMVGGMSR